MKPAEPLHIPNYFVVSRFDREIFEHGGTVALVSECNSELFSMFDGFDDLLIEREFEFSVIHSERLGCFVVCIYRSPQGNSITFLERLELLLSRLPSKHKIILAGDFNIDFENKNNTQTLRLSDLFQCYDLTMHINHPTRVTDTSSTTIDYIVSNIQEDISCDVFDPKLSDHHACLANIPVNCHCLSDGRRLGRIYGGRNFEAFRQSCQNFNWSFILQEPDPLGAFHGALASFVNINFPIRRIRPKRRDCKRWLTPGIRTSASNLRFLNNLKKAYPGNTMLQSYYSTYRKTYRLVIRNAKRMYYSGRLSNATNLQRESWAIVNEITHRVPKPSNISIDTNTLNNFYCSVADNLTRDLHPTADPLSYLSNVNTPETYDFFPATSPQEVEASMHAMKNKSAATDDGISLNILRNLPNSAIVVLSKAINRSFETGCFPACFKIAKVIPLYKGGDHTDPSNYRPISLLSTLSKLVESLVKTRLWSFLHKHSILNANQYGFQTNKNTSDAMFDLLAGVFRAINGREVSAAVFCDLSKAFDCVSHEILLRKLNAYGFRGNVLTWFRNYLNVREQSVHMGGVSSSRRRTSCGVPQGSVLGPILFLIYINDLTQLEVMGTFTLFADDTTVLWRNKDLKQLMLGIVSDLEKIGHWCDANRLCLNMSKTHLMGFNCTVSDLFFGGDLLNSVDSSRFLGLLVDEDLKFHAHIVKLNKKLASGCYCVRATFQELGRGVARDIYFALVESHLRYALPFWGACSQLLFQTVFALQKRAVRNLSNASPRTHCKPLFIEHNILTLPSLFILETAYLIHKNRQCFPIHQQVYATRRGDDIPLPIPHSSRVRNSFVYNGVKIYNHVDPQLRSVQDLKCFRRELKKYLLRRAFYSVDEFF